MTNLDPLSAPAGGGALPPVVPSSILTEIAGALSRSVESSASLSAWKALDLTRGLTATWTSFGEAWARSLTSALEPYKRSTELVATLFADQHFWRDIAGASYSWAMDSAQRELEHLAECEDDWDGEGGRAAFPAALATARELLAFDRGALAAPTLTLNETGTISIEWETRFGYAFLEIGQTRYALLIRGTEEPSVHRNGKVGDLGAGTIREIAYYLDRDPTRSNAFSDIRVLSPVRRTVAA